MRENLLQIQKLEVITIKHQQIGQIKHFGFRLNEEERRMLEALAELFQRSSVMAASIPTTHVQSILRNATTSYKR